MSTAEPLIGAGLQDRCAIAIFSSHVGFLPRVVEQIERAGDCGFYFGHLPASGGIVAA